VLSLDCGLKFEPSHEEEFFAALPAQAAVFVVEMNDSEANPYLARTANLRMRLERLLRVPEKPSKRLNLREIASGVQYRLTGSRFEQALVLYKHAKMTLPRRYRSFLRMRPPALLKLNLRNEYPRCYVTRRIFSDGALYLGPFPSRKNAEHFADEFLNLFKIRRCQIKIRRDPEFPGCIYSEMKMCLAPCFAGCSKGEYDAEVARVREFLQSRGTSLLDTLEAERSTASEAQEFEHAASLHKRVEKVESVLRSLPDLPRPVETLDAIVLQRAVEEQSVAVFVVRGGYISEPIFLNFAELQSEPRSLEQVLREKLDTPDAFRRPELMNHEWVDHLSLLGRWFYSKPRAGEIFFPHPRRGATSAAEWPYRRMIRACSRILKASDGVSPPAKRVH
jgi:excinuclease UvrABC nuclease subunit